MLQVAVNEFALTAFYVCRCSEAVVFQFVQVIGIVKRFLHKSQPHGVDARQHRHAEILYQGGMALPRGSRSKKVERYPPKNPSGKSYCADLSTAPPAGVMYPGVSGL